MQSEDDREAFEREFRQGRLATASLLERAWSMLPPDLATRAAIDGFKRSATLNEYHPRASDQLTVALDGLEVAGDRHRLSAEFWLILKDVAVQEALYGRAAGYRERAAAGPAGPQPTAAPAGYHAPTPGGPSPGGAGHQLDVTMSTPIKARVGDLKGMGAWIQDVDSGDHACEQCGHPWQEHHLCATSRPPTEGWIECPVEGCNCQQTWSLPPDTAAEVRKHYLRSKSDS